MRKFCDIYQLSRIPVGENISRLTVPSMRQDATFSIFRGREGGGRERERGGEREGGRIGERAKEGGGERERGRDGREGGRERERGREKYHITIFLALLFDFTYGISISRSLSPDLFQIG